MFSLTDYGVFLSMIAISCMIGIYFGCLKKNQTTADYLLGGSKMTIAPVTMSMIASNISGITLLALPADVYLYGANIGFLCISMVIVSFLIIFLYLPVIMKLKVPSGFEYLNLRFDKNVRTLASLLFTFHLISPLVCIVCMFYTTIGGFKAVIWSDVLQFLGMVISMLSVILVGIKSIGGFDVVLNKAAEGHRLDFDFSFDPTIRDGFWPIITAGTVLWLNILCFNPSSVQKYLSTSSLKNAKNVVIILCISLFGVFALTTLTGVILYAKYEKCDPFSSGKITKPDQILIHFFFDVAADITGLPGIFIAGIFSASLSSLSTSFNTLAATVYGDFILPNIHKDVSPKTERNLLKLIVVVFGMVCTVLTFAIDQLTSLQNFVSSGQGCMGGLFVGLYSLGMLFPKANSKGAFWGTIVGFVISFWIASFNQWYNLQGAFNSFIKPLSVDGCNFSFNSSVLKPLINVNKPFILYRLSYWYSSLISAVLVTVVGVVISCITKSEKEKLNPELISPFAHFIIKKVRGRREAHIISDLEENEKMMGYKFEKK
ncbi:hypothetical protein RN001_009441 [Aquatica leii]|uniref:Sodium-dependent multivitamin transporter n=1 Tax=Aquatica leii TaxID=1421715 RepID=A0AAN7Q2H3_9COLE|nr:hypothetical protein RN001_009441 [Aquatica leii]